MKKILLVLFVFISLNAFSQLQVKEGSFKYLPGGVIEDKVTYTDDNESPMALIKISTENIPEQERMRLVFTGNRETQILKMPKTGQMWIYISAEAATFIDIKHPDYGTCKYYLPEKLCEYCKYEMVLQYVSSGMSSAVTQQNNYLTIIADQPNASIYIDDEYVSDGFKSLAIGTTHTWKIECDMYHTESGSVMITKGEPVTIEKQMRPAYGFINVTSKPESGAVVFIDNKKVGTTPYQSDKMASGTYKVRVVKDMYKTTEQTFTITDENTTNAVLEMSANFVNLNIETDAASDIYIDGQYKGKGKWSGRIADGAHFLEVKKDKHRTVSKNLNLVLGKDENLKIEAPTPITGFLDISSLPVKANIYLNGKHYGTTPRIISDLLIGDYTLKLEKEGCASVTKKITIEENQTLTMKEQLPTGKDVTIKTDKTGDKIYVDGSYVGTTPLTTNLSYGSHNLKAERGSQTAVKTVEVKTTTVRDEFVLAFGKMVKITSDKNGDDIYVDGKKIGETPMDVDMPLGKHELEVRRGKLYETGTVDIGKDKLSNYYFIPKKEPLEKYLSRGVNFITLNAAYSIAPQTSFGFSFGSVKKVGWFVSAMSNFDFIGFNTIDKPYEEVILTGNAKDTRISVTGGVIAKIGGPVYFKAGAGYGMIIRCCETASGDYVEYTPNTYKGVDFTAGLQLNLRNLTIGIDAVTTNFQMMEFKLGIGFNWN
ncbi:MAG: PEGA domain-containing protein [Bacteroidales bacterium]|nr:PEGA domain-containing protein [Bacteroidales bacterium]